MHPMSARARSVVVVLAFAATAVASRAAAETPSPTSSATTTAQTAGDAARTGPLAAGMRLYNAGQLSAARDELRRGYDATKDPTYLFHIAQCWRLQNTPEEAVPAYRAYLRERPNAPDRPLVELYIREGESALRRRGAPTTPAPVAAAPPSPTTTATPPSPTTPPAPASLRPFGPSAKPAVAPEAIAVEPVEPEVAVHHTRRRNTRKWLGWAVLGGSAAGLAIGVGLIAGLVSHDAADPFNVLTTERVRF